MKDYGKASIAGGASGAAAFLVSYYIGHQQLLKYQPRPDGTLPPQFTSFPPQAAALPALVWAGGFFVVGFAISMIYQRLTIRSSQPRSADAARGG